MATHSVFLLGESHGQRSLAGYSPWGRKESDTPELTQYCYQLTTTASPPTTQAKSEPVTTSITD